MIWLEKLFNYSVGGFYLLFALVAGVVLLPFILICFIAILTPPPFTLLVNLVFPLFFFLGPNGAQIFLDKLVSGLRYVLERARDHFRRAKEVI